jgi:hypothetical protein
MPQGATSIRPKKPAHSEVRLRTRGLCEEAPTAPVRWPIPCFVDRRQYFKVLVRGKPNTISVDRLKPAYVEANAPLTDDSQPTNSIRESPQANQTDADARLVENTTTRSGRKVKFPAKYCDLVKSTNKPDNS